MFEKNEIFVRYPALEECREDMEKALAALIEIAKKDGKVLVCGNGGSCADSDHIVGELMKGFLKKRPLSLTDQEAWEAAFYKARQKAPPPKVSPLTAHTQDKAHRHRRAALNLRKAGKSRRADKP